MKKVISSLLLLLLLICLFGGCVASPEESKGQCTVVIGADEGNETVYTVDLGKVTLTNGLLSVIEYLNKEEGLVYTATDSGYGAYLTQVGDVKEDASKGEYIYIWTSVESDHDVSVYATTKEYNGKTLISSGVGASQMKIEDNSVIYIGVISWN